jgi:hypothetical protein
MITEHLMRPGGGSLQFTARVPADTTFRILNAINGAGCHVFVTSGPMDANVGAAAIKSASIYAGVVTDRSTRTSIEFDGIGSWLDTKLVGTIQYNAGTPTTWLNAIMANGLSLGSVSGASNVTRRYDQYAFTHRDVLDSWAALAGVEYDIRPDFKVYAGPRTALFRSPPAVLISDGTAGSDATLRGLKASLLDQKVATGARRNRIIAIGDDGLLVGQQSAVIPLKTHNGLIPLLTDVVSAPGELQSNLSVIAGAVLALRQSARREVTVSTSTTGVRTFMRPGDDVYLWGIESGLFDGAQPTQYRGDLVSPALTRLLSMTWPIEAGHGVFVMTNSATPEVIDVTPWMEWEPPGAFMTVGDRTSIGSGAVNRSEPALASSIAGIPLSGTYTPSLVGAAPGADGNNIASWWFDRGELTIEGVLAFGSTAPTYPGPTISIGLPPAFVAANAEQPVNHGGFSFINTGVGVFQGSAQISGGRIRPVASVISGSYVADSGLASTVPFAWGPGDYMQYKLSLRAIKS